jgi:hypothetical protein
MIHPGRTPLFEEQDDLLPVQVWKDGVLGERYGSTSM